MPIYEYRCSSCGHEKEALQKLADAPLTECAACGKNTLRKLISAAGFQLKGSGWYATDFKGGTKPVPGEDKSKSAAKDETGGKKESGDKQETGSRKEPGSKEESKPKLESESKQESKPKEALKSDTPASGSGARAA